MIRKKFVFNEKKNEIKKADINHNSKILVQYLQLHLKLEQF